LHQIRLLQFIWHSAFMIRHNLIRMLLRFHKNAARLPWKHQK
jgi:hypothetical protein